MPSLITQNAYQIKRSHYLRNATPYNHWFDFSAGRLAGYVKRYGENFCLIINGSHEQDDAYILPYKVVKNWFLPEHTDARGRWVGTIIDDRLKLTCAETSHPVGRFRNAFAEVGLA